MLDQPAAATEFLQRHGIFGREEPVEITFLSGGVSSLVIRACGRARCVVVKQALPRLKVQDEWLSRVERALIEARCAAVLNELVPGSVPTLLAVDEEVRAFVMECAPAQAVTWKSLLMDGTIQTKTAGAVGRLLGRIHHESAAQSALQDEFADRSFFDELRLDPYLRTLARRHPDLAAPLGDLVTELLEVQLCLVHGDYSPKNLLVHSGGVLLLDHEVAHWGNPIFDAAFVLNHLCLKALKFPQRAFAYLACAHTLWQAYLDQDPPDNHLAQGTARLLGGLLLARVDGKSPVEYLTTEAEQQRVRVLARGLIAQRVDDLEVVFERVAEAVRD